MSPSLWNFYHSPGAGSHARRQSRGFTSRGVGIAFAMPGLVVRSVLIIDGDEPSVKLARTVLEPDGWRVIHAPDREHAHAVLAQVRPSLIVTALSVPMHAALELVREMRASTRSIPIVAVTALNGPESELAALEAGCSGFLRKPIDIATFSSQLGAYLGKYP